MRPKPWLVLVLAGALVGMTFAGFSTYDFVQHLDRQVHSVHCSFIPGLGRDTAGTSGCQVAMMSPYSSVMRSTVWGGIPISLPAMSVFAFILFFGLDLLITRKQDDPRATAFLALASILPAGASAVMAFIALSKLGTTCKLCVAIYLASAACLVGALILWRQAVRAARLEAPPVAKPMKRREDPAFVAAEEPPEAAPEPRVDAATAPAPATSMGFLAIAFAVGVAFVVAPVGLYAAVVPKHDRYVGTCDGLTKTDDPYGVMVRIGAPGSSAVPAIEILDPLCPACRAFEERLDGSGMASRLDRKAVLFPLDSTCNWMVDEPIHPGACVVSEAVLCAGERAGDVVEWAFAEQDKIREAAAKDPGAAARIVGARFPELASCIGSATAKSKLNKSLRWAVQNGVQVLTPQLYVDGVKLCDEDVDLGLEFALSAMLDQHDAGTLVAKRPAGAPAKPEPPMHPAQAGVAEPSAKPAAEPPKPTTPAPAATKTPTPTPAPAPAPTPAPAATPAPSPEPAPAPAPTPDPAPAAPAEPTTPPPGPPEGGTP
jgi:uncharacterized membrane protein